LKSTDRGKSWESIKGNIPDRTLVWRLVQDHVNPKLLFAGTEFGIYFTIDGGSKWIKLTGGVPTISFRDLAIQRRENDLVGATFGRGFYVFDDYGVLRHVSEEQLKQEASLFPTRKTWWYIPRRQMLSSQGAAHFTAPNPPHGAVFTYYLKEEIKTEKELRKEREKKQIDKKQKVAFPGWDKVEAERRQEKPQIWLTVRDTEGNVVRRVEGKNKKGFHRVAWDLRFPPTDAISSTADLNGGYIGAMVGPGNYSVTLSKQVDGTITNLSEPAPFSVERLYKGALAGADPKVTAAFWKETERLNKSTTAASRTLSKTLQRVDLLQKALIRIPAAPGNLDSELHKIKQTLMELDEELNGNRSKREIGEKTRPTIARWQNVASSGTFNSTYGPTPLHRRSLEIAGAKFVGLRKDLENIVDQELPRVEKALRDAGAPWIEGQSIPEY